MSVRNRGVRHLVSPVRIGPYEFPNRMVMAPMTRNRAGPGNAPTEMNATYYAQRASAGLIVTEATPVEPRGHGYPGIPGIHTDRQQEGWTRVTDTVHREGGRIFLQLWHTGRVSHPLTLDGQRPVGPSALTPAGTIATPEGEKPFEEPRALETEEIPGIVERFREAARRAYRAGFDGVELHAANGYLVDQFLRADTNLRGDRYGGSLENRCRFLREVVEALVDVWGDSRVAVRLSPLSAFNDMSDPDPFATFETAAEILGRQDLAYLHVVEGADRVAWSAAPEGLDEEGLEDDARELFDGMREAFGGPYTANGGYDRQRGEEAVASGRADLVSFARLFLANPDLPRRFAEDLPLNEPDPDTFYGGDEAGYIDYPTWEERQGDREEEEEARTAGV